MLEEDGHDVDDDDKEDVFLLHIIIIIIGVARDIMDVIFYLILFRYYLKENYYHLDSHQ